MPQEIRVLQCSECKMFQVDLVKKGTKWTCKICNLKQSFVTEYFRGSGPDCRVLVQELNKNRGLSVLNACKFTLERTVAHRREQQNLSPGSMKFNEKEFANDAESANQEYSGRDVDIPPNKNSESFENAKEPTQINLPNSSNKRISIRNGSCDSIKKICKWDKYV
ncbi:MRN complex-interacting protein [Zeugodacus cucurbitae]|uniref:UPF0544 protein C5orf45 homolog n=1 Tax=Zeugodacus cucurbitae TaxID=28588 RepID=A0A0A1XHJ9_ZEUCU|nr:MRN complex-interacting protein [Zeugodacus cucurbitae]